MDAPVLTESLLARFWSKVDRKGPDECWPWTASRKETGYGQLGMGTGQSPMRAHRLAHFIATGEWPDAVLHRCDNPPCCNPAHLLSGDQATNLSDMRAKGRHAHGPSLGAAISRRIPRGERHYLSKLSDADRQAIRDEYAAGGVTQEQLAARYGVCGPTINVVIRGRRRKQAS